MFGPLLGRAEGSVRGGPKTAHMGPRLAGARNGPNRTTFQLEIVKDLAPVRNRENRSPGPVGSGEVEFDVVCSTSAAKLRSPFARKWVASISPAHGSGLILAFAAGLYKSGECVIGVQRLDYVADDRHQYHHRRLLSSSFVIIFIVIVIVVIILVIIILVSWPLTFLSCLESLIPISLSSSVHVCVSLFEKLCFQYFCECIAADRGAPRGLGDRFWCSARLPGLVADPSKNGGA